MTCIYRQTLMRLALLCSIGILIVSCYSEDNIVPTPITDDLLFDFPQGNSDYDRTFQIVQEKYGSYPIYKDITDNLLNRAWVNLYPNMYIVSTPIEANQVSFYADFLLNHILQEFNPDLYKPLFPRYIFMVNDMHRVENGIAKSHMPAKLDGVDFWAISFKSEFINHPVSSEFKKPRIMIAYGIIEKALNAGLISIPVNFTEGVDYETMIYDDINDRFSKYHYQNRGFVKYVQPDFEYESPITNISIVASHNQDFLMFVRKILYSTPQTFEQENGEYDLLMKRYQIVLDCFTKYGIDLNNLAIGPSN